MKAKILHTTMGQMKTSVFGCVVAIVLLLQLGLHTQLLQGKPGISGYRNISDEFANQYYDGSSLTSMQPSESMSSSSRILLAISPANRNKRFLQKSHSDFPVSNEDKYFMDSSGITPADNLQTVSPTTERNPWDGVSPDLTIANFYTGDFLLPNERLCSLKHNLSLVVLVPSAVTHFKQREAVRNTWGSFTQRRDVVIGFVVGDPNQSQVDSLDMEGFQKEIDLYGDIIIANFKDTYRNLTLKALYMVEWTSRYCSNARFFMKTDDDVFLNVPLVLDFIAKIQESDVEQPKIYGNVFSGHMPQRNTTHRHHVNHQVYPHEVHYPNFTSGPSYLISAKILRPLLKQAVRLPLFNLEDVLLTGFAASELDIPRINVTLFRNELENPFNMPTCKIVNIIAGMTDGSAAQIYHVWYNYLMGTVFCKYLKKLR